jgi:nitrite reductase (NO-forming)
VTGPENKLVYSGKISDEVYLPEGTKMLAIEPGPASPPAAHNKLERMEAGRAIFGQNCAACHQPTGLGIPGAFPPLAGSDFLKNDPARVIQVVTGGLTGKIVVNGKEFNGVMPAWHLSDEDIANVLTYIYNTWGNSGKEINPDDVRRHRVIPKSETGA